MDYQTAKAYCLSRLKAREDYPFGPDSLVVKVGTKLFAMLTCTGGRTTLSLKCDPFLAQNLRQQYPSVKPGYHLNKEHWNTVTLDPSVPDSEICWMVDHSYDLVVKGLTRAEKAQLAAED